MLLRIYLFSYCFLNYKVNHTLNLIYLSFSLGLPNNMYTTELETLFAPRVERAVYIIDNLSDFLQTLKFFFIKQSFRYFDLSSQRNSCLYCVNLMARKKEYGEVTANASSTASSDVKRIVKDEMSNDAHSKIELDRLNPIAKRKEVYFSISKIKRNRNFCDF